MLDVPSIEQYDKIKYNFRMYMEMGGNIYYEKKKAIFQLFIEYPWGMFD